MRRREFIAGLAGVAALRPFPSRAQGHPKILRVGYSGILPRNAAHYAAFEQRMAELGYQPGRNFVFDYIQSASIEDYPRTYEELAAGGADILLAGGNEPALKAAQTAAGTTPIVFIALDFDPVEKGYVGSFSHPGGNNTGVFVSQLELAGKRIEFLRANFPYAQAVGLLWDDSSREQATAAATASERLGFRPRLLHVTGVPPDYETALSRMDEATGQPVVVPASPLFLRDRGTIVRLLVERRMPSICALREVMEAGALISYGVNLFDVFRAAADLVDQVAKGAKAGDVPMRESARFHIAFNLATARRLGLDIAPTLLASADEVIE